MFEYAVIGKGLIGSAAARHLVNMSRSVVVIGPDEPENMREHKGVFASHYDSGRITRILDTDYVWGLLAKRSIERYRAIEEESKIPFFQPVGCIKVVPGNEWGHSYLKANEQTGERLSVNYNILSSDELKASYPYLNFPSGAIAIAEIETAGHINPREMLKAQLAVCKSKGASIICDTVTEVTRDLDLMSIKTSNGEILQAENIVITAGAFSNFNHLLRKPLNLTVRAETIALMQIDQARLSVLKDMPCIIWFLEDVPHLKYVYLVPPVVYPDGNYYVKIGGDREVDHVFADLQSLEEWFHSDGGAVAAEQFEGILHTLLPAFVASVKSKPCVITDTATQRPYIGRVDDGVFVATGGCGAAAKSSDEIGRLAALSATAQETDEGYGDDAFQVVFADMPPSELKGERRKFEF